MKKLLKVDIAIPVYHGNLKDVERSVKNQVAHYRKHLPQYNWQIVLAINGANPEAMIALSKKLAKRYKKVGHVYTTKAGKGNGIITAWTESKADIMAYMDVDLSTDLKDFKTLLQQIENGYDLAIGSRYLKASKIQRSLKRFIISKGYVTYFYRLILGVPLTDAQCGYKAVNRRVVKEIVPLIKERIWFWESEMLYLAYKKGFRIKEVPVVWIENEESGVNLVKIIPSFIKNILRLRFSKLP